MKVACIGSRQITPKIARGLFDIGKFIAEQGWTVVSGNATGSDAEYARGANMVSPNRVKLFLPWATYNKEQLVPGNEIVLEVSEYEQTVARRHHPIYDSLTQGARRMMDRNAAIVLDSDVVLAVLNHKATGGGGTGHGWRVAKEFKKPQVDLSGLETVMQVDQICKYLELMKEKLDKSKSGL